MNYQLVRPISTAGTSEISSMKVVLELQDQPSNIKKVTVRHDIVIGRGADCNLRLSAPQVSRRHCFLRIGSDGAFVSDLESSNGTFLNGIRLTSSKRYELENGAVLSVGPVKFIARVESEVSAGEMLQVNISDDRIEAELIAGNSDNTKGLGSAASPADGSSMNFAIEHGGPSSSGDEPTADYTTPDCSASNLFGAVDEEATMSGHSDGALPVIDSNGSDTVSALSNDLLNFNFDEDETTKPDAIVPNKNVAPDDEDMESDLRSFLNGLE